MPQGSWTLSSSASLRLLYQRSHEQRNKCETKWAPGGLQCYHVQVLCDDVKSLCFQCSCEDGSRIFWGERGFDFPSEHFKGKTFMMFDQLMNNTDEGNANSHHMENKHT